MRPLVAWTTRPYLVANLNPWWPINNLRKNVKIMARWQSNEGSSWSKLLIGILKYDAQQP